MSIFLAVVLSVSGDPSSSTAPQPAPSAQPAKPATAPPARSGRELADATHAALRKWAKASDKEADAAARDLLTIYTELQQDTRLARSTRETLRTTVRARLDQLCTQIGKRIAKEKTPAKVNPAKADPQVKSVAAADNPRPLAQVGVPAGGGGGGFGGPGGGQQNAAADNGQALVDLIQNTISPKSWDANGGNCTIYYWQQQHAIVVRATGDIHGEISDALQQLDRASH